MSFIPASQVTRSAAILPLLLALPLWAFGCGDDDGGVEGDGGFDASSDVRIPGTIDGSLPDVPGAFDAGPSLDGGVDGSVLDGGPPPEPATLAAGSSSVCALREGEVRCWGRNDHGQLGVGDLRSRNEPSLPVALPGSVEQLVVGHGIIGFASGPASFTLEDGSHGCAILADETLWCWGRNHFSELGDGTTEDRTTPVRAGGLEGVRLVAAGAGHTCAVTTDRVVCFGGNDTGQLGDGSRTQRTTPVDVVGLEASEVQQLIAGEDWTCARLSDGSVSCWGRPDATGGAAELANEPTRVPDVADAVDIDGDIFGICAVSSDGLVTCWGAFPDETPQTLSGVTGAQKIAVGGQFGCGALADGSAVCLGFNDQGQLGDGTFADSDSPVPVSGLEGVVDIVAGSEFACASQRSGDVRCWGLGDHGQLGDGRLAYTTTLLPVSGLDDSTRIEGMAEAYCALRSSGNVSCWGLNDEGQLGTGDTTARTTPAEVEGLSTATAITAGERHACALEADGNVRCWGSNLRGQLGNGTLVSSSIPVRAELSANATAIASGFEHTCALLVDGRVECFGGNSSGQVGNGTFTTVDTPARAIGVAGATEVYAGTRTTCARLSGGSTMCWGSNAGAQHLVGSTGDRTPTPRLGGSPLDGLTSLHFGFRHACALGTTAECWGFNADGQLGDPSVAMRFNPRAVASLGAVSNIDLTANGTCVVLASGQVSCWGRYLREMAMSPTTIGEVEDAVDVATGSESLCVTRSTGGAACAGAAGMGARGDGVVDTSSAPVSVVF